MTLKKPTHKPNGRKESEKLLLKYVALLQKE